MVVVTCDVARPAEVTELRRLRRATQGAAIVVVSPPLTTTAVRRALDAGADALVVEPDLTQTLIPTLRAVESGSRWSRATCVPGSTPYPSHRERQCSTSSAKARPTPRSRSRWSSPKHDQKPHGLDLHQIRRPFAEGGGRRVRRPQPLSGRSGSPTRSSSAR